MEEFIKEKDNIEYDMYSKVKKNVLQFLEWLILNIFIVFLNLFIKFVLILNEKKAKIRELSEASTQD